jgi:hypothetical protein
MEMQNDEMHAYINRRTGELFTLTDEDAQFTEDDEMDLDDLPDWRQDVMPKIREVMDSDDWLRLPSQFDIHEYRIMEDFCHSVTNEEHRSELLDAIRGRGAFRFFKSTAGRLGLLDDWYKYRDAEFARIAAEWLDAHGIAYVE